MKFFGFLLVAVGFLAGAYYLTGARGSVIGTGFAISFAIAIVGIVILRVVTRKRKGAKEKVISEVKTVEQCISRLAEGVDKLEKEKDTIDVYDLSKEIDDRFNEDLERFVDARESIAIAFGLNAYASVMSHFAAGERYLNRVWSCSVDGYIDEAHIYLGRARDQFVEGHTELKKLTLS
ncbi:MAG: hypothetical protein GTO51_06550 [Candidatus Latescibacteria bacterium]|nr:hypothetical protein [Candidatus Latescibacterota bacterium]NIM21462.1 hypothetical protein [Candidatus Latescibacterota bacterium]NIM65633.1 hypothetical protein [Candidatus Latescibacterota bacterium]NIO02015.1 hypothetical protein [Candidatus Latescibacterota bacterium]NIO28827.1 hypothetical protein [Candidatus Latescibacterota bacterium]